MLKLLNVSKTYRPDHTVVHALHETSLHISAGDFLAVVGPSGSGKSTLLYMMAGLEHPTHGQILFEEKDVAKLSDAEASAFRGSCVGFIAQDATLLNHLTVLENVMVPSVFAQEAGTEDVGERAENLLRTVGLHHRKNAKPLELSGGQRQRVCIAQALINRPKLLVADEPTGSLDSATGAEIIALFEKIHTQQGCAIVIATHDEALARKAKKVLNMKDGRLDDRSMSS